MVSYIQVKSAISHNFMPYFWQFHFPANFFFFFLTEMIEFSSELKNWRKWHSCSKLLEFLINGCIHHIMTIIQSDVHSIWQLQFTHHIIGVVRFIQLHLCAYFMLHIITMDPYLHLCTEDIVSEFYQVQHTWKGCERCHCLLI